MQELEPPAFQKDQNLFRLLNNRWLVPSVHFKPSVSSRGLVYRSIFSFPTDRMQSACSFRVISDATDRLHASLNSTTPAAAVLLLLLLMLMHWWIIPRTQNDALMTLIDQTRRNMHCTVYSAMLTTDRLIKFIPINSQSKYNGSSLVFLAAYM